MNNTINIKIKKIDERAVLPSYAHAGDVGMDLTAISVEYDEVHDAFIYHTGLAFESDFNVGQFLFLRSSNKKTDAYLTNGVGIADSAIYRGEIMVAMKYRDGLQTQSINEAIDATLKEFEPTFDDFLFQCKLQRESLLEASRTCAIAPYNVGDRVAQMVFLNYPTVNLQIVDELSTTDRGDGGFGSTGK